jgi:2-desacetyl-2-hydroxyethyl bacteriochlorophyllide A dehydrogenase
MKTIILQSPGDLRLIETPAPGDAPEGFALVRVHRVGICGTDWHAYRGKQPFFSYPRIIGHELGVIVEQVNEPASSLNIGDRCSVEPYLNCGRCIACLRGKGNCCVNLQVMGVHVDGGMRQHVLIPAHKLHPSAKLEFDQLALVETLAIGCHAVDRAAIEKNEWTLIIGAGPIGLSVIPFAVAGGAKVIVMDVSAPRLTFCREAMGVEHTIDAGKIDPLAALRELTDHQLPTAVIDATGNPQSMMQTFNYVAHGGRIVFVGLFQGDVTFNDPNFHRRELSILATRNARPQDFARIIRLVEEGVVDTKPWITHRTRLEELVEIFPRLLDPGAGVIKAIVEF